MRQLMKYEKMVIDALLCLLLLLLIVLACFQIFLRTFFSGGLLWADPFLRHMVLWCGLLGAVVATRERKHICIDVVAYLAPEKSRPWFELLADIFSTLVTAGITWAAILFVRYEYLFTVSSLFGLPSWIWGLIFPIAFGLMTLHFLLAAIEDIQGIQKLLMVQSSPETNAEEQAG